MTTTSTTARADIDERAKDSRSPFRAQLIRRYRLVPVLVLAQTTIALDVDIPIVRPLLALFTLLGVPTLLLYRRQWLPGVHLQVRVLYALGLSLLSVIVIGLALNVTMPLVGVDHPLGPTVLAATWLVLNLALLSWGPAPQPVPPFLRRHGLFRLVGARMELAQCLAVGSVVFAVVGAARLNNGAGGEMAKLALALATGAILTLLTRPARASGRDVRCLALVATSLLLATSLRGWEITGHDIQAEYVAFTLTNDAQYWSMGALQNAYNACLSVTILPTVLAQTTALSGVFVFKVLLQLVFALVPVLTFLLAKRFMPRRLALAAAIFTMAFPTFFTDMPYLVRQEIAFFFLALLLLVATEPDKSPRVRWLVAIFGVGVVLSHYSTTYLMLMGLVFGLVALLTWTLLKRRFGSHHQPQPPLALLSPVVIVFLTLASLVWAGPATHTGGHASEIARETLAALIGRGNDSPGSSDVSYRLFSRDTTTPRERLDLFVERTLEVRESAPARELLIKRPRQEQLRPDIVPAGKVRLTRPGQAVASMGVDPSKLHSVSRMAGAVLLQVFLLFGMLCMVLRRRGVALRRERGPDLPRELVCLVVGAVGALGLIVLIPNLSVDYGVLRAFQQTLLIVAPVVAAGMWVLLRPFARSATALAVALPVALFLIFTGAASSLLGGHQARLALENSGLYYDRYHASDTDVRATAWLAAGGTSGDAGHEIIASRSNGMRIVAASKGTAPVADRLYPTLLTRGAYVFVDSQLLRTGHTTISYSGDLITYVYPLQDLDRRLDLIYSSGESRIYR